MRERMRSASPFEDRYGFCRALRIGRRIEVAGTAPIPQDGAPTPDAAYDQMIVCGEIALDAIRHLGGTPSDVIRTRVFITSVDDADQIGRAHRVLFGPASPVATMVVVAGLLDPNWKVEIEVEAEVSSP